MDSVVHYDGFYYPLTLSSAGIRYMKKRFCPISVCDPLGQARRVDRILLVSTSRVQDPFLQC